MSSPNVQSRWFRRPRNEVLQHHIGDLNERRKARRNDQVSARVMGRPKSGIESILVQI